MKKSGGFFFAIAAIAMAIIIWGNPINQLGAAFLPTASPAVPPAVLTVPSTSGLTQSTTDLSVDLDRLMAHIQALAKPRASQLQKEAARRYIIEQLATYGITAERQQYGLATEKTTGVDSGSNLVAKIPGSGPASLVLGAHYDTAVDSPGADDNASAIAALLETARIFSKQSDFGQLDSGPADALRSQEARLAPKSLTLVFFDQEERQVDGSGLLGSIAFTEKAGNLTGVNGAIILDMIGYACHTPGCQVYPARLPISNLPETGNFLAVLGLQHHTDLLGAFAQPAPATQPTPLPTVLSLPVPKPMLNLFPDLLRSDHAAFWEKGIPAVFVSDTANFRNPNYHTPQDTPDTLDPAFFKGSAQHVVNAIAALLNQAE